MPPKAKKKARAGYMISAVAEIYKIASANPASLRTRRITQAFALARATRACTRTLISSASK